MPARQSRLAIVPLVVLLLGGTTSHAAAPLTVAAASDLQPVMPEIVARFERSSGRTVRVSYGSSGQFAAQIQNGAPFDVFLSADEAYIQRLVASGDADGTTVVQYATGRLALWTRSDRGIDITGGIGAVADARVRRLAIANPDHAPYGRAAVDALRRAGLYEQVRSRLVLGENVSQAAQFAQTGNADVAIIALSLTGAPAMRRVGTAVELPRTAFPEIRQSGVIVARSANKEDARRFLAFMTQPDITDLLRASGFGVPQP